MRLARAGDADLAAMADLVNCAFRGEAGWTSEASFLAGLRTDEAGLRDELRANPEGALYVWRKDGDLIGCVWLKPKSPAIWYLGMLSVRPDLQDRKLGRALLDEAEAMARGSGAHCIEMTVVNVRHELIAWYQWRGYVLTGETRPFPYGSPFGQAKRDDLHFVVLEKRL